MHARPSSHLRWAGRFSALSPALALSSSRPSFEYMTRRMVDATEAGEPDSATSLSLLQFAVPTSNCTALNNYQSTSSRSTFQSTSKQVLDVVNSWQLVATSGVAEAEERGPGESRYF